MRPKKKLLFYCADEPLMGELAMVMRLRIPADVVAVSGPKEFLLEASESDVAFDGVVVCRSASGERVLLDGGTYDAQVFALLASVKCDASLVEMSNGRPMRAESLAQVQCSGTDHAEMVESMRIALSRKTGPRSKGAPWRGFSVTTIGAAAPPAATVRMVA